MEDDIMHTVDSNESWELSSSTGVVMSESTRSSDIDTQHINESSMDLSAGEEYSYPLFEDDELELLNLLELEKSIASGACELQAKPKKTEKKGTSNASIPHENFKEECHCIRILGENQLRLRDFLKNELHIDMYASDFSEDYGYAESISADLSGISFASFGLGAFGQLKKQNGPYECTLCDRKFVHGSGLVRHMEKHELNLIPSYANNGLITAQPESASCAVIKCTICGRVFFDLKSANEHVRLETVSLSCAESKELGKSSDIDYELLVANAIRALKDQYNEINSERSRIENFSDVPLRTDDAELGNVMAEVQTVRSVLQCEFCDFVFTEINSLLKHSAQHSPSRPFECTLCGIFVQTAKEIATHFQVECVYRRELLKKLSINVMRYVVCNICKEIFLSLEQLHDHRIKKYHFFPRNNKDLDVLELPCDYCADDVVFASAKDFVQHYNEEHFEEDNDDQDHFEQDNDDQEQFTQENDDDITSSFNEPSLIELVPHKIHWGQQKPQVQEPETSQQLKQHIEVPTPAQTNRTERNRQSDTPFSCPECDHRFRTRSAYYQHRAIHRGERRYACDQCDKRFYRGDALKNHKRIHTGERPFECLYCMKTFRQRGDCDKHVRSRHGRLDDATLQLMRKHKLELQAKANANAADVDYEEEQSSSFKQEPMDNESYNPQINQSEQLLPSYINLLAGPFKN